MKTVQNEELEYQRLSPEEQKSRGILGRLVGVCADIINPTRNGRHYSEDLWEKVFNSDIMKEKIANKVCYGELGHPADREEIDPEKIAVCLTEMPAKGKDGKLRAVFDILDTPCGRILKSLCDYGSVLGISSRGTGDVVGDEVDPNTYNCECFDIVLIPAVKEARLKYVTESLDKKRYNKTLKQSLQESLNKAEDKDKKVITESLNTLGIYLTEDINNKLFNFDEKLKQYEAEAKLLDEKEIEDYWAEAYNELSKTSYEFYKQNYPEVVNGLESIGFKYGVNGAEFYDDPYGIGWFYKQIGEVPEEALCLYPPAKVNSEVNDKWYLWDSVKEEQTYLSDDEILEYFGIHSPEVENAIQKIKNLPESKDNKKNKYNAMHLIYNPDKNPEGTPVENMGLATGEASGMGESFEYESKPMSLDKNLNEGYNFKHNYNLEFYRDGEDNYKNDWYHLNLTKNGTPIVSGEFVYDDFISNGDKYDWNELFELRKLFERIHKELNENNLELLDDEECQIVKDIIDAVENNKLETDGSDSSYLIDNSFELVDYDEKTDESVNERLISTLRDSQEVNEAYKDDFYAKQEYLGEIGYADDYDGDDYRIYISLYVIKDGYPKLRAVYKQKGKIVDSFGIYNQSEVDKLVERCRKSGKLNSNYEEIVDKANRSLTESDQTIWTNSHSKKRCNSENCSDKEKEVDNVKSEGVVAELQESLKQIKLLKQDNLMLQEQLSVSNAKEMDLKEDVAKYKSAMINLSTQVKNAKCLKEDLAKKEKLLKLKLKEVDELSDLNENLKIEIKSTSTKSNQLTEQVNSLTQQLEKSKALVSKYQTSYRALKESYLKVKANNAGLDINEVRSKLSESYKIKDIDSVCEELSKYKLNLTKLPFRINEDTKFECKASNEYISNRVNDDDYVSDTLLQFANIK